MSPVRTCLVQIRVPCFENMNSELFDAATRCVHGVTAIRRTHPPSVRPSEEYPRGKCHSATGDVHRFGARPSKTNNEPRALLAARGYWSLALFLRGVGATPFASCGCRTRNLGTGTGGVRLHIFLTRRVVTMLRAYASRVGVFLRDFLSFFSRVAARSGAVVSCVHDLRLWSTFSQGLQLWWGGGAFVGDAFPAVVACVLARLCLFAKKKPTVDLRVVPRRLGRAALESPCTDPSTQCFPCNRKSISR